MRISDWSSDVCSSDLGTDTAANQEEANAKFAADQAEVDARAEQGAAQVEAERIRREGKAQRAKAVAAAAASGVDVNSPTALKIDQEITANAEEDAMLTILNGGDRAARLNQQGQADRRSEEHTSEPQQRMRIPYAVVRLKNKNQ